MERGSSKHGPRPDDDWSTRPTRGASHRIPKSGARLSRLMKVI
jgi:hypothetical protein